MIFGRKERASSAILQLAKHTIIVSTAAEKSREIKATVELD
jgi:hypothetical protein